MPAPSLTFYTNLVVPGITENGKAYQLANHSIISTSANYTVLSTDEIILATGTITITLPIASANTGKTYTIKRISTIVTIDVTGGGTIDGSTSISIGQQYSTISVISDGSEWWTI